MRPDILEAAFRTVLQSRHVARQLTVIWHAGEPLTLPPDWYRDALVLAEKWRPPGLQLDHHFQSNGMLLNDEWIAFLGPSSINIGLSIDGPASLHDAKRKTRAGVGTHARAMRGLGLLLGVELVQDRASRTPAHTLGALTTRKCFEKGLSMNIRRRPERGSVWRIAPPLTVSHDEIDRAIDILDASLRESLDELAA